MRTSMLVFSALAVIGAGPAIADQSTDPHAGHAMAAPAKAGAAAGELITAPFVDASGKQIGKVTLRQTSSGVLVKAHATGLVAGEHGFHFHEKGTCDVAGKFNGAGGHFNPGAKEHGMLVAGGMHGGDMPNQYAGKDGMMMAEVLNAGISLGSGAGSVRDADGTALVIHAKPDDYASQPSGAAGDRVACAVISKPK